MDMITGAQVAVTLTVALTPEQVWDRITDVARIGEWSPEATGANWDDKPAIGARFTGRNRFPNGLETTVTCEVTAFDRPKVFAWVVLDDDGRVFAAWRYELLDGDVAGTTRIRNSFTHGPGVSGSRVLAEQDPRSLNERLGVLARNMADTITSMAL